MCSTLEYASIRLKSGVPSRNSAATSMENKPNASSVRSVITPPPAASTTCLTRSTATNAIVVIPPASSAPTRPGASP